MRHGIWEYCFYCSAFILWLMLVAVVLLPLSAKSAVSCYVLIILAALFCCVSLVRTGRLTKLHAVLDGWWLGAKRLIQRRWDGAEMDDD